MEFTDKSIETFGKNLLEMSVPTQLSFKTPLVYRIVKELKDAQCLPWTGSHRAELCLDEVITNAMTHGNDLDPAKKVKVQIFADNEKWGAIIEDEGAGFGPEDMPDMSSDQFIFEEAGRGIMLMESYLDKVQYNRQEKRFLMVRQRQTEPDEAEAAAAVALEDEAPSGTSETISTTAEGGVACVDIMYPRIDGENVTEVRDNLNEAVTTTALVCLDLSHVEYVSSVGLGALVSFYKLIRTKSGHLLIVGLQPAVKDILETAHLLKLFPTSPDRDSAVKALKKRG